MPSVPMNDPPYPANRSITTGFRPKSMAWMAAAVPVPPAPTMHTSASIVSVGSPNSGMDQI